MAREVRGIDGTERRARGAIAVVVALASVLAARAGRAQTPPQVRIVYTVRDGAAGCPDEDALRALVAARLGYDPFQPDAPATIEAEIARTGRALHGRVQMRDAGGAVTGSRELRPGARDCSELAASMALAISIAVDPLSLGRASPPPPPPPPPPPVRVPAPTTVAAPEPAHQTATRTPPPAPRPPVRRSVPSPVTARASVGGLFSVENTPGPTGGPTAQFGVLWRSLSVGLEGRLDLPSARTQPGVGTVSASVFLVSLVPCFEQPVGPARLLVCALGGVGAMQGSAEGVTAATPRTSLFAAAGARAGAEIALVGPLALRVHADLLATLTRTSLVIDDRGRAVTVWTSPPLSFAAGAAAVVHFR